MLSEAAREANQTGIKLTGDKFSNLSSLMKQLDESHEILAFGTVI